MHKQLLMHVSPRCLWTSFLDPPQNRIPCGNGGCEGVVVIAICFNKRKRYTKLSAFT